MEKYIAANNPKKKVEGRSGIIYFEWIHPSKPVRVDHIDLLKGKPGKLGDTAIENSYYFGAKKTWFLPLKG